MAIASMVLGIVSVVCSFIGGLNLLGLVLGVVGLILGIIAKKKAPSGMATAGIVLSIIGISITLLVLIACAACLGNAACALSSIVK